jgi:tRNA-splicing ligase RtcB
VSMVYDVAHNLANIEEYEVVGRVRKLSCSCETEEAHSKSFSSTCHGAGLAMSRTRAKKVRSAWYWCALGGQVISMAVSQPELLAEEAPYAYKDISQVVRVCEAAGLSRTMAGLRPVGVVKG